MNRDQRYNLNKFLDENIRYDGRTKDQYREVVVTPGVSCTAEGSVQVDIGNTSVIAGVKMEAGSPYGDTPNEGVLMVNVELSPIANQDFETGAPGFNAIELARVTDRGIRESRAMDTEKLCIVKGEKVWMVNVDIVVLNDDGNLFDACSLAAIAAIKQTKIPGLDENNNIDYHAKTKKGLPLVQEPIGVTVYKVGKHIIVDPSLREVEASDGRLTVTSLKDGTICAMQKGGEEPLTSEIVLEMVDLALEKSQELRKFL